MKKPDAASCVDCENVQCQSATCNHDRCGADLRSAGNEASGLARERASGGCPNRQTGGLPHETRSAPDLGRSDNVWSLEGEMDDGLRAARYGIPTVLFAVIALLVGVTVFGADRNWHEEAGYRWREAEVRETGRVGFSRIPAAETGIAFANQLSEEAIAANRVLANGSGVAVGDYDGDGLPDIYFCGLETPNALYRNLGNWKFKEVASEANVACAGTTCRGAVFADVNGDGHPDLLVSTLNEGVIVFRNDGSGRFTDASATSGTRSRLAPMTMALADIDGDGSLDLYVGNNRPNDIRDQGRLRIPMVNGKPSIPASMRNRLLFRDGRVAEYGQPDQLFLNDGQGRFREVQWNQGVFLDDQGTPLDGAPLDWALTVTFRDVNHDLAPDLYVCNDFWTPDRFWINDGRGRFRAIDMLAYRQTCASSMGIDFSDFDRDGELDFFVMDMLSRDSAFRKRQSMADKPETTPVGVIENRPQVMRNTLFRSRGDGTYAEVANLANVRASDWSWSPICLDVDLDGYEDLLISAGHFRDVQDMDAAMQIRARQHSWSGYPNEAARQRAFTQELLEHNRLYPPLKMPVIAFRNTGNWRFEETTDRWGFHREEVHQGMALGDFDLDGDWDVVVNVLNGEADVYRNEAPSKRVFVRLTGRAPNTEGIGSEVILRGGACPAQSSEIISGGRYLSGSAAGVSFAAGSADSGMTLEVRWRGGGRSVISDVAANRIYEIDEANANTAKAEPEIQNRKSKIENPKSTAPLFEDVSHLIAHSHSEPEFNDFERQPLLPFRLSQRGPGAGWFDLDGDGHDDLIVGTGNRGAPGIFRGNGRGGFERLEGAVPWSAPSDMAGIVGWHSANGERAVLAGLTGYEGAIGNGFLPLSVRGNKWSVGELSAGEMSSASALALGDMNGDGRLDLFVGGGVVPGHYPLGAPSRIYRHDGRQWRLDAPNNVVLERLGIVNGAVWSDLTGDGLSELVVACEWGPVRVFHSQGGRMFEITKNLGLESHTGWWQGVATGDIDGDGRLDIVASNWGLNSPYRASEDRPLIFVHGQLARPGVTDVIETEYDKNGNLTPRHPFMTLAASLPFLFEQFPTHRAYSEATLDQVLGARKALGRRAQVTTLASTLFLNRGSRFEPVALPLEAQFAPAFGVNVGDLDGDGNEDICLSQNFFATRPEMSRMDAGRGLLLRGDGTGGVSAVGADRSGIKVYGEQRASALGDFNEDGRIDLVVTQNGAATKLYKNVGATPGLRVRLKGPASNPAGIGSVIRLKYSDRLGSARSINAGSGYWSQDSETQIMGIGGKVVGVQVHWPGVKITSVPVPEGAKELTVTFD